MKTKKIEDVFGFIRNGVNIKQGLSEGGIPITRIETISKGYIDINKLGYAGIVDYTKYNDYILQQGDILMSHINSISHLGKVAIFENIDEIIIHGMNLLCLRAQENDIYPKYAFYYFRTTQFKNSIARIIKKSVNQASFSVSDIKKVKIPVPSMEAQVKIANALDKAQELIDKRKEQIEKLDEFIKSVFIDMFGNPVKNTKGWKVDKLSNHVKVIGGYAFSSSDYIEEGVPIIKIGTVNKGVFDTRSISFWSYSYNEKLKKYEVYPGDLLITLTGTVGKDDYGNVCIVPEYYNKYLLNQRVAKLELNDQVNKQYIRYCFEFKDFKNKMIKLSRGIRQANISNDDIYSLDIPIPTMNLQNKFADIVEKAEQQKELLQKSLTEMENNFNCIMQKAFRGELFTD